MDGDITGRDGFLIGQALYRFIQHEQDRDGPQSDIQGAKDILLGRFPEIASLMIKSDKEVGRKPADLLDRM